MKFINILARIILILFALYVDYLSIKYIIDSIGNFSSLTEPDYCFSSGDQCNIDLLLMPIFILGNAVWFAGVIIINFICFYISHIISKDTKTNTKKFRYRIYENVYNDMLSGKKTIEYRLLDSKSESINIGDTIEFMVTDNEEKILNTEVIDKYIYNDIDELWNSLEKEDNILNTTKEEFRDLLYNIFGKERVDSSKIVGFKIKKR